MADMHDSGHHMFMAWAKQQVMPNGQVWHNRWLGEFNPEMTADEANQRLDHVGKLTTSGQTLFKRGWSKAQADYLAKSPPGPAAAGESNG
jgi:hypothetical protein